MPRCKVAAGSGSSAVAALKGRASNQPSCYVNVGTSGVSMTSVGHYSVAPAGLGDAKSVSDVAVKSTYFRNLTSERTSCTLDTFLNHRGPSFAPTYAPRRQTSSFRTGISARSTPEATSSRVTARNDKPEEEEEEEYEDGDFEDDEDSTPKHSSSNCESNKQRSQVHMYGDDDDDEDEDEDEEDEPLVGGSRNVSEYDAEQKARLLQEAFAFAAALESKENRNGRRGRNSKRKPSPAPGAPFNTGSVLQPRRAPNSKVPAGKRRPTKSNSNRARRPSRRRTGKRAPPRAASRNQMERNSRPAAARSFSTADRKTSTRRKNELTEQEIADLIHNFENQVTLQQLRSELENSKSSEESMHAKIASIRDEFSGLATLA